jgi:dihydrofolate synthase/folylpolyglutamate synthase
LEITGIDSRGSRFIYKGKPYEINLAGRHQIDNAMTALECAFALRDRELNIPDSALARGLAQTQWPGRLQIIHEHPTVIIDVAHNTDGMQALCEALRQLYGEHKIYAAVGMCADKQANRCIPLLAGHLTHCFTAAADTPRAIPADDLAGLAAPHCPATACASVAEAVKSAVTAAGNDGIVLICGTFYMMPEAWKTVKERPYG